MNMDRKMEVERKVPVRKALLVTHVSGFLPQFEMNNVRIFIRLPMARIIIAWMEPGS